MVRTVADRRDEAIAASGVPDPKNLCVRVVACIQLNDLRLLWGATTVDIHTEIGLGGAVCVE